MEGIDNPAGYLGDTSHRKSEHPHESSNLKKFAIIINDKSANEKLISKKYRTRTHKEL